ncbi:MAG: hypothetical protein QOG10_1703 [Kribbellaceae bacterium]|jgi:hypothetical protein|nr:hypothetical protein [Kribbellaceae bacterium]
MGSSTTRSTPFHHGFADVGHTRIAAIRALMPQVGHFALLPSDVEAELHGVTLNRSLKRPHSLYRLGLHATR